MKRAGRECCGLPVRWSNFTDAKRSKANRRNMKRQSLAVATLCTSKEAIIKQIGSSQGWEDEVERVGKVVAAA